jgi:2-methylisocitrate lyase-like PEP mutase family enzyme
MTEQRELAARFLDRHRAAGPLLLPNAWDAGSAAILASLGFEAIATTSSGHAATLGRLDGAVTRDEAIAHAAQLAAAVPVPVSADLEHCFAGDPGGVAQTVAMAIDAGLAGCSIEDWDGSAILAPALAAERVAAAAAAAHAGPVHLVLTARAENHVRGRDDLDDTIARLQAFERAGADVLYPTGLTALEDIRRVVDAVGAPVNVLVRPDSPNVAQLADAGVARISVGGAFAFAALGALADAAEEFRERGTHSFLDGAARGAAAARDAFA